MKQLIWIALLGTAGLLAGCDQGAPPLPGERVDVRPQEDVATNEDGSRVQVSVPIALPAPVNHAQWTHRGGSALHKVTHPALGASLVRVWSADIGSGNSKRYRISADPVVAEGRIYTLDSRAGVMAHSLTGKTLWSVDATPASDNNTDATGGGLAFGAGRLFVTTGFGELLALDPATGDVIWRQSFDASVSGAPTVQDDMVYVMARDNAAFAVRADNGRLAWTLPGAPSGSEMLSGAGPAVTERAAIFPSGNSELVAALTESGVRSWVASIA
ncbi:MAG: outer membrane protein assembly factor BamB, partial [Paracoccaceae bacterium]